MLSFRLMPVVDLLLLTKLDVRTKYRIYVLHHFIVFSLYLQAFKSEEEFLLHATSKIAHLCAYNVVLWQQFAEICNYSVRIAKLMAKEYHQSRVSSHQALSSSTDAFNVIYNKF